MLKQEKQSEEEYNVRKKTRVFVADYNKVFNTIWCFTVALSQNIFFANYRMKESKTKTGLIQDSSGFALNLERIRVNLMQH